jgi:hypothetical protein
MIASAVWRLRERNPYPFAPTMNVISAQAEIHVASLRKFNQERSAGYPSDFRRKGRKNPALETYFLPSCSTACEGPVDRKQYDGADGSDYGAPDKAATAETDEPGQPPTHNSAGNPEYDRDDKATRIVARHNELGERASNEAHNDPEN